MAHARAAESSPVHCSVLPHPPRPAPAAHLGPADPLRRVKSDSMRRLCVAATTAMSARISSGWTDSHTRCVRGTSASS